MIKMAINLSQTIKKRKISNKIFVPVFILFIIIENLYYHNIFYYKNPYLTIVLYIIDIIMLVDVVRPLKYKQYPLIRF